MKTSKWTVLPGDTIINDIAKELRKRNIGVEIVADGKEAMKRIGEMIPPKSTVMTGGSTTLNQIGFTELLKSKKHPWKNLKEKVLSEKDMAKQTMLRRESTLADYFLGSVHAVSVTGETVIASFTGSQLPAYAFSSPHVIWVVGAQKVTPDLESAIERVKTFVLPLEDERMKKEGYPGSAIGKLLIFEKEVAPGRVTMILVKEKLGF